MDILRNDFDLIILEKNTSTFQHVKNQTEETSLAAVKRDSHALKYINQTEKICLEAVKLNGWALCYVKNQTDEICLAAVKQNGKALQYVKNQTKKICSAAIKQDSSALEYVKNKILKNLEFYKDILKNIIEKETKNFFEGCDKVFPASFFDELKINIDISDIIEEIKSEKR